LIVLYVEEIMGCGISGGTVRGGVIGKISAHLEEESALIRELYHGAKTESTVS
jgi:hypothetical protein